MGIAYNNSIVRDGLVLHLDAANPKSYPGSGTTWFDLSGNNKNAQFINAPVFNSTDFSFIFDGVNDYMSIPNSYDFPSIPIGLDSRTLFCTFNPGDSVRSAPYEHLVHYGSASTSQAYGLSIGNNINYLSNHTWSGTSTYDNRFLEENLNYVSCVKFNNSFSPKNKFFLNGDFGVTGYGQGRSSDYSINTGSSLPLKIGSRVSPGEYFSGKIYSILVYNRDLSDLEIQKNFNALRDRYGI